jgi:predicted nucleotidyltransferase
MIPDNYKQIILDKTKVFAPKQVAIFGSYARGEQTDKSDLDILIDTDARFTLLDLIGIEQELTHLLSVKVDLVTKRSLSPYFKSYIEKDLLAIS